MMFHSSADREAAPPVPPVERAGVRYAQAEDGREHGLAQAGGVLLASDAASGALLWTLQVYAEEADAALEGDVQWVFFTSMAFTADGHLRIVNEAGQAFLVDVARRQVLAADH